MKKNVKDSLPVKRTKKQADASRRNGSKSKGPITKAGKKRSRCNAVTHGLFAGVIPERQQSVFANRREYDHAVQQMHAELGIKTVLGTTLLETLTLDFLRIRQIRAMEISILDGGSDNDRELANAIRDREYASQHRSDELNNALFQAYSGTLSQVKLNQRFDLPEDIIPAMLEDLWEAMNSARDYLAREHEDLLELDEEIASADPEDIEELKASRSYILESIADNEAEMEETDRERFLIREESQLEAYLAGRKKIPLVTLSKWVEILDRRRRVVQDAMGEVRAADARIHYLRQRHLQTAVGRIDELNRLGEYEDRIRRSITKTLPLIKQVEADAVMDI